MPEVDYRGQITVMHFCQWPLSGWLWDPLFSALTFWRKCKALEEMNDIYNIMNLHQVILMIDAWNCEGFRIKLLLNKWKDECECCQNSIIFCIKVKQTDTTVTVEKTTQNVSVFKSLQKVLKMAFFYQVGKNFKAGKISKRISIFFFVSSSKQIQEITVSISSLKS